MVFSSTIFLFAFLPATIVLYFLPFFKGNKYRNTILLIMSLIFYAWGEPVFVFLMIASVFFNWIMGLLINKYSDKRKLFATIAIVYDVALLFVYKYLTFITENIAWLSGNDSLIVKIALPIGISFFTFQMMSYVFDVAKGKTKVQHSFWRLLLYICMFPQLVAGPIVRYETIEEELDTRTTSFNEFSEGTLRFIKGLMKKVLIANNVAVLADTIFAYGQSELTVLSAWLGAIAYTLQIYYDFSGYSDMAIGIGKMFGFHFSENFDRPYFSKSISEFWRKWHISMGSWFRDYVYFPLGGSRRKMPRVIFNLLVVWLLTGIWHGAGWTFVMWGFMYFVLLTIEKLTKFEKSKFPVKHIYTMFFVILGWVLFRSESISSAMTYILAMFGLGEGGFCDSTFMDLLKQFWWLIIAGSVLSVVKIKPISDNKLQQIGSSVIYILGFLVTASMIVKGGYNPFIYFNF